MPSTRSIKTTKSPSGKKTTSGKGRSSGRSARPSAVKARRRRTSGTDLLEGLFLLLLLFVCAAMLISDFGNNGYIGSALCAIQYGVFGRLCFFFPVIVFICTAFLMANYTRLLAYKKVFAVLLAYVFACGLVHMFTEGYDPASTIHDYYVLCSDYRTGGGAAGGALCMTATTAFGHIGAIIIMILGILVCLIVIFRPSLVDFVMDIADHVLGPSRISDDEYEVVQTARDLKREVRYQKKERQRQEKRLERIRRLEEELAREKELAEESARELEEFSFDLSGVDLKNGMSAADEEATPKKNKKNKEKETPVRRQKQKKKKSTLFSSLQIDIPDDEEEEFEEEDSLAAQAEGEERPQKKSMQFAIHRMDEDAPLQGDLPLTEETARSSRKTAAPKKKKKVKDAGNAQSRTAADEDLEDAYADAAADLHAMELQDALSEEGGRSSRKTRSSQKEIDNGIRNIRHEIAGQDPVPVKEYLYPPIELLRRGSKKSAGQSNEELQETAARLEEILGNFGVNVTVTDVSCGPTVTRYELQPEPGVKVSRIVNLSDDIKLNLAAPDIRIEAPIPGKAAVGIEVPNKVSSPVMLRDLIASNEFQSASSKISFAVGKDIAGQPIVSDIARMPHLLIAGATGSGKSVCINTLIISILFKARPDEVQLIMIDPKVVELSVYNGIPHLLIPVVTDPKKAAGALNWAVSEMSNRYNIFAEYGVRNIVEFNHKISRMPFEDETKRPRSMSQIVIIVDELADLMMVAPGEVEDAICRLAQLARAAGIHLVIATQRPSVNVITGLIKANMPSRIAFAVSSGVDSRTILDTNGAEKLLGKGDMLFSPQGMPKPARLQGAFVSDDEVGAVVEFLTSQNPQAVYDDTVEKQVSMAGASAGGSGGDEERDQYFIEAGKLIIDKDKASIGMLQRMFKIGFNRAARIMDQLAEAGVVGPEEGTKPRRILMSPEQFENYLEENG